MLTAAAQNAGMFIVGHVIQGLCTSLLLIAAVPPLALGYPRDKLRDTAVIMNLCIFGAVALGPFIGGLQAEANAWRPLFWIVAGISAAALLLVVLTFDDAPPANPDSPRDLPAIALATVGCVAAFFGAAQLTTHRFLDPVAIVPMVGGLATIVVLVVYQYRAKRPLLTIRTMLTSSIPVAGVTLALFAAASVGIRDSTHRRSSYGALQPASYWGALPPRGRRRGGHGDRARPGPPEARHPLSPVGRHDRARCRHSGLPCRGAPEPGADASGLEPDRDRARGHGRTGTLRRRLFTGVRQPAAGVRDCRTPACGGRVHGRADIHLFRLDDLRQSRRRYRHNALGRYRARHRRRRFRSRHLRA